MNIQECDILNTLRREPYAGQRVLAQRCGHSLGAVNKSVRNLIKEGYLDETMSLTPKAAREFEEKRPRNAVILAAGFGMRMVPINQETPKAFLEVAGQTLIERIICQLHEVGIREIYVVVGFMKEKFEFLIDEYGVELVVNRHYASRNNLHSLSLVRERLANTYIIPCDLWCAENPFRSHELYSWYMVSDRMDRESQVRVNRKMELAAVQEGMEGNAMVGIAYLLREDAQIVRRRTEAFCQSSRYDNAFWEETLFEKDRMFAAARIVPQGAVVEIDTYEQLRELDGNSSQLRSDAIAAIADALGVSAGEIVDIEVMKKGMTNRSFLFTCRDKRYIMRIPGEGTDQLINRRQEADVYQAIGSLGISDDIFYIDPDNGYKITAFREQARVCDPKDPDDLTVCMQRLKEFHDRRLKVAHTFDIFEQIGFYESLWEGTPSVYRDYQKTKQNVFSLQSYIDAHAGEKCLTHIDAVPDNFLISDGDVRLIDWEYAGMQDPHVDLAMFCIYAMYDKVQTDRLIDIYFSGSCSHSTRVKIYCYIAACGLLWSNWCEYKRNLGVEFGEYSLRQYRFAKEYYKRAKEEMAREEGTHA